MTVMNKTVDETAARPPIVLIDEEADLLADLAVGLERSVPELAQRLLTEIDRAQIVAEHELPASTVRLGSEVEFASDSTGRTHMVKLVLPNQADPSQGAISVLSPAGVALIGLSPGQSIEWPDSQGKERALRVVAVRKPA